MAGREMDPHEATIAPLLRRYGAAVDGRRWHVFDEIFGDNIHADYGPSETFEGLAAFKAGAAQAWGSFDASQHTMSNIVWECDADGKSGRSLTYGDWFIVRRGVPGGDTWQGKGWYYDEWELSAAGWRIHRRFCRPMWWTGNPLVPDATFDPAAFDSTVEIQTLSLFGAMDEGLFRLLEAKPPALAANSCRS